jgi:GNAT superfamily N-acetyltransferase
MKVINLDEAGLDKIIDVFNRGFQDYIIPVSMDSYVLKDYIHVNDISLKDSFMALDGNDTPQSFTFTGIRDNIGWVGGLAVDPEHRGMGYGRAVLKAQLERVRELDLDELWLECIDSNDVALGMYKRVKFKKIHKIWFLQHDSPEPRDVRCPEFETKKVGISEVMEHYDKEHIWPKSAHSLKKMSLGYSALAVKDGKVMGYIVSFPGTRSTYLWDMSANKYGEALLAQHLKETGNKQMNIANLHNKALLSILQRWGFVITLSLWVMRLKLRSGLW